MAESLPKSTALQELAARGFVEQMSDAEAIDAAFAAGPVTFYIGYDPTAPSLHVGNLVTIMAMRRLQRLGHRPIVVLGGGTARVGDPSGKTETRRLLPPETIAANTARIGAQIGKIVALGDAVPNGGIVVDNHDWLGELKYIEFLRDVGVHFTVNRMVATKTYRDRLDAEEPLSFIEFNYQLFQSYDFLQLHRRFGCTMQLGGGDQWGNMIAGVELVRRFGLGPVHCMTFPLLTTATGQKMGKTEKGSVWLDGEQTPPFDYYQYWIGCDDRDVRKLLLVFTDLPVAEIDELCRAEGAALRDVKQRLAFEATAIMHGRDVAEHTAAAARQAFGGGEDWSAVPSVALAMASVKLVDLVVHPDVAAFPSKRAARQRIEDGAVRLDGVVVKEPDHEIVGSPPDGLRLQAGKKHRVRVVLQG